MNRKSLCVSAALLAGLAVSAGPAPLPSVASAGSSHPVFMPAVFNRAQRGTSQSGPGGLLSGVSLDGVPHDMNKLAAWEQNVPGKAVSIVHFWAFWSRGGQYQRLIPALLDNVRRHGSIPMVTWAPEEMNGGANQPSFRLVDIMNGRHDDYVRQWAADAKAWGHPFFLRWAHEPDGNWFPWGEEGNGNRRGQYVHAWRHVHDIFREVGATNVTWVWCPNIQFPGSPRPSYSSLYPGDAYVDWTCLDGYNWGSNYPTYGGWDSFEEVFRHSYEALVALAPGKPVMLGEWASSETGGSKSAWINDALSLQLLVNFPKIKAAVWYNYLTSEMDWRVESSPASSASWRSGMASGSWRAAEYGNLERSPIPAP